MNKWMIWGETPLFLVQHPSAKWCLFLIFYLKLQERSTPSRCFVMWKKCKCHATGARFFLMHHGQDDYRPCVTTDSYAAGDPRKYALLGTVRPYPLPIKVLLSEDQFPFPKVGYVSSLEGNIRFVSLDVKISEELALNTTPHRHVGLATLLPWP